MEVYEAKHAGAVTAHPQAAVGLGGVSQAGSSQPSPIALFPSSDSSRSFKAQ